MLAGRRRKSYALGGNDTCKRYFAITQTRRNPTESKDGEAFAHPRRVVAVLAILSVAALWLQHHFGFELQKLGLVAVAGGVWAFMGKLADWLGETTAMKRFVAQLFRAPLRKVFRGLTHTSSLYALGGVVVFMMATLSSVVVRGESP